MTQPTNNGVLGLEIRAMRKATENMQPYQRQDCPRCGWPIETAADGIKHCKFCTWQDQYMIRRDVYGDR